MKKIIFPILIISLIAGGSSCQKKIDIEKEKEAIIAEGERLKEKIVEQAKANIDFELQKAKETLKSDAALMALELAEKEIREKLGQKEQESLIDDYVKRLEAKN